MAALYAMVRRGQNKGIRVTPHRYVNGKYRVALRKEGPYADVDYEAIVDWIKRGYGVRMGNRLKHHPPGLFMPDSILGWK